LFLFPGLFFDHRLPKNNQLGLLLDLSFA
jgi:hypothetical protein